MANFYLDVSAIGNEYQAYSAVPATWGVPQDGSGRAGPGHAASVAIATIDCSGATTTNGGVIMLGAQGTGTLNASGAALAAAMAVSINGGLGATNEYSQALLPMKEVVFARVNPALNTEVQVMMRFADAAANGRAITFSGITGATATPFAGGADGPFAYLGRQDVALFGKAILGYGMMTSSRAATSTEPGQGDVIHVRTRRAGVDLTVQWKTSGNTSQSYTLVPVGGVRNFRADAGDIWAGDAGVFTVDVSRADGYTTGSNVARSPTASLSIDGNGLRFRWLTAAIGPSVAAGVFTFEGSSERTFYQVLFEEGAGHIGAGFVFGHAASASGGGSLTSFVESKFVACGSRKLADLRGNNIRYSFTRCEFEYFGLTSNVTDFVTISAVSTDVCVEFTGCKFADRNGVFSVLSPVAAGMNGQAAVRVVVDGCTGISEVASGAASVLLDYNRQLLWENFGPEREWRVESGTWVAEWRTGQNFPTLNSMLPSGSPWSVKALLRSINNWSVQQKILKLPGFYRAPAAVRTVTLEFLAQAAPSRSQIGLVFAYIDDTDVVRYQSTLRSYAQHLASPIICDESSALWDMNGQAGFTAYKLGLVTDRPIKSGSETVAWVMFVGSLPTDQTVFIDAEVSLV